MIADKIELIQVDGSRIRKDLLGDISKSLGVC